MENKLNLLKLLNATQSQDFRLVVLECLGMLVLQLHWQRGIIDSLVQNENVKLSQTNKENWDRVIGNLELYESFCWEICPPRAMLLTLRHYRITNELPDNFQSLNNSDFHGRIPYGLSNQELDDIEDIVRKIKDARQKVGCTE